MNILKVIGRKEKLFSRDVGNLDIDLYRLISASSFLVIGGAGSIGQAVSKEIFKRNPKILHVVDINENNLVELVRDIRSTLGYIHGDFKTFAIDCGGVEFNALLRSGCGYDYVLNLSALKHVRSEKDPFTLMRMIKVNILNTLSTLKATRDKGSKKYFCVSTDKATNPVNMMGASKRIMEMFLMRESVHLPISTARFANVAFSDGSLLHGFSQRIAKNQPITAPNDVERYFVTPQESGELCLISALTGNNREIYFPKVNEDLNLTKFSEIAVNYLEALGFDAYECTSEEDARGMVGDLVQKKKWPVYFFKSDTTGEKAYEEFFTDAETLDLDRFDSIGIIKNELNFQGEILDQFFESINKIEMGDVWKKEDIVRAFDSILTSFNHQETGKYLDGRM